MMRRTSRRIPLEQVPTIHQKREVLKQPMAVDAVTRPRNPRRLPLVFSRAEVKRLLDGGRNPKHRVILSLLYAAGLRLGEVVRLKAEDIDRQRMLIRVHRGKGRKDRYTLLPHAILGWFCLAL